MERRDHLVRRDDDHEAFGGGGHDPLPGLRSSPSLDQPSNRVHLVGPVDREVEAVQVVEGRHLESVGTGRLLGRG